MGVKRGKCQEEGCVKCPHYQAADDGSEGGPCLNCGHFPGNHEPLGKVDNEDNGKIYYDDPDPLGLLQEPGNGDDQHESVKQLQDLCEWTISGNELRFLEKLGSGRTAKVYKGLYKDQIVAIKVLKPILEEKELRNFKAELDIMRMVDSKHVVKFFGGCLQPKICLVMEYCANGSLYHLLQRKEFTFDWPLFFRLNIETVLGVLALHTQQPQPIVHRDLKSLNLLVNADLAIKVCDFGVSRYTAGSSDDSTLGKVRGTLAYTAPEIYFGKKFSTKSDVFSMGIIFWEYVARMLTGEYQRPYKEYNFKIDFQILINVAKKGKRPTIPPSCPESLKNLVTTCWSHEAQDRPETAQILQTLRDMQVEYESNKAEWDSKLHSEIKSDPKPDAASENGAASSNPVWSHKTADQVFGPGVLDNTSTAPVNEPAKTTRSAGTLSRSASKKLISMVATSSTKVGEEKSNTSGTSWTKKGAEEVFLNGEQSEPKVVTTWKHTTGDWRDEDAFPEEKKKKRGLLDRLKGGKKKNK